jgi:release factor glutamine methyltransferase
MKLNELINYLNGKYNISRLNIIKKLSMIEKKDIIEYMFSDPFISEKNVEKLEKNIKGYPIEYLVNEVQFLNNIFYIDERVLIPRVETEDLVLIAKKIIEEKNIKKILDLGTGSGVIAITLKKFFPDIEIIASDISFEALEVFKKNCKKNKVNIKSYLGSYLEPFLKEHEQIDLIISNPPYVEEEYKNKNETLKYEPDIALFAGKDGQNFYRKLINKYYDLIKNKTLLFETTEFNVLKTYDLIDKLPGKTEIKKDSFGIERFIYHYKNSHKD